MQPVGRTEMEDLVRALADGGCKKLSADLRALLCLRNRLQVFPLEVVEAYLGPRHNLCKKLRSISDMPLEQMPLLATASDGATGAIARWRLSTGQ